MPKSPPYGRLVHLAKFGETVPEGTGWRSVIAFYADGTILLSDFYREEPFGPWERESRRLDAFDVHALLAGLRYAREKGWVPARVTGYDSQGNLTLLTRPVRL